MKTLHLNLASKPFRDYRPVWLVATALGVASLLLLLSNAQTAYRYFGNTERTRTEIDRLQREVAEETRRTRQTQDNLRRLDRKSLNLQARFVNSQITERAFSWSELLDQLERVIPNDVRLTSLDPSVDKDGMHIRIRCLAKTANGLVDVVRRMQADPHFAQPFPESEQMLDTGVYQFSIRADYRPEPRGILR